MTIFIKRFMLVYLLILVVILVAFSLIYSRSANIVEESLINNRLANLQQIRTNVDNNLSNVIDSISQVSSNWQIRNFADISEPYHGPNIIRIMETIRVLQENNFANTILRYVFIVYDINEVVITPAAAWQLSRFGAQYMLIEDMTPYNWRELVFNENLYPRFIPAINLTIGHNTFEAIQYIVPIRTLRGNTGAVIALLDNRAVQDMFNVLSTDLGETALIINSAGEVITALSGMHDIPNLPLPAEPGEGIVQFVYSGANYLMIYTNSQNLDWTYVSVIRSDYVLAELNMFRNMVFLVLFIMTIITFAIAIAYSVLQSRPIKKLHETISAQIPLLQHSYLRDLFEGKLLNAEDETAAALNFDLTGTHYMVVFITAKEEAADLAHLAKVHMFMDGHALSDDEGHAKYHCLNLSNNELAVLFIGKNAALDEHVRKFVNLLTDEMSDAPGITIGIGCAYNCLEDVKKSYSEAVEAVQYFIMTDAGRTICPFSEVPNSKELYYYPDEEEKRLLNMVRSGDDYGVHESLKYILNENFIERKLSNNMITAFINHLCLGLFKIGRINLVNDELSERVNEFYNSYNQLADLDKMTGCTQLYTDISKAIFNEKQNKMHNIVEDMKMMCKSGFQNPDLSLTDISSRHNLSEAYLSQQFKEQTGENFHSYLQDLRINFAIKQLVSTDKPIREISETSGYISYNTFSKAFKRKTGISAGDYRRHKSSIS